MEVDTPGPIHLTYPQLDEALPNLQDLVERALVQVLWDDPRLHSARLRLFLARFCSVCIRKVVVPNSLTKGYFRRFRATLTKVLSTLPRTWIGTFQLFVSGSGLSTYWPSQKKPYLVRSISALFLLKI